MSDKEAQQRMARLLHMGGIEVTRISAAKDKHGNLVIRWQAVDCHGESVYWFRFTHTELADRIENSGRYFAAARRRKKQVVEERARIYGEIKGWPGQFDSARQDSSQRRVTPPALKEAC